MVSLRCKRCNVEGYLEKQSQPEGEGCFNILKKREYLHCRACGYFQSIDDYKKQVCTK